MTNKELLQKFEVLVLDERKAMRAVLEHIALIEERKAYLDLGFDGIYAYLTQGLKYSEGSAYRRIQASRMLKLNTKLADKIESGHLNLSQMAEVAKLSRMTKKKPSHELFEKLELQNKASSEKILAQAFDMAPQDITRTQVQKDSSVRLELTFSAEEFAVLEKARSQLSHLCPFGEWASVFTELARQYTRKMEKKERDQKDSRTQAQKKNPPLNPSFNTNTIHQKSQMQIKTQDQNAFQMQVLNRKTSQMQQKQPKPNKDNTVQPRELKNVDVQADKRIVANAKASVARARQAGTSEKAANIFVNTKNHSATGSESRRNPAAGLKLKNLQRQVVDRQSYANSASILSHENRPSSRRKIRIPIQREVYNRSGGCCESIHPKTGRRCQSRYQLQFDHIIPVSKGGTDQLENLQILCAQHNRAKGNQAP